MAEVTIESLKGLDLEDILKIRKDLEQYIDTIDEYVITSKTDLQGIITYASKAFERVSGYSKSELIGKSHNIIRHPDMDSEIFKNLWETIENKKTWSGEILNRKKDGTSYWVDTKITPTYDFDGNHIGYTSVREDITDRKRFEEVSLVDELTTLFNRRYYNQVLTKEMHRATRDKSVFFYLLIDIDFFKKYNDTYGHKSGDIALEKVSKVLKTYFKRATDIVFRLGGEEFCVIYSTECKQSGIELAQNLSKEIEKLKIDHKTSRVSELLTLSMGLVICNFQSETLFTLDDDALYQKADELLYQAKENGRNQIVIDSIE